MFGLSLTIYERMRAHHLEERMNYYQRCAYIHLIINIICLTVFVIFLVIDFIFWSDTLQEDAKLRSGIQLFSIILVLLIVISHALCTLWNRILAWSPKYRYSRAILFLSSLILIVISIAAIILNSRVHFLYPVISVGSHVIIWCYKMSQANAGYTVVLGVLGVTLALAYGKRSQLNKFRNRIRHFLVGLCLISLFVLVVSTTILSLYDTTQYDKSRSPNIDNLIYADTVLSTLRCIVLVFIIGSISRLKKVMRPGRNGLTAERIQLIKQPPSCIQYWATAIDAYHQEPGGMTGDAALQLMMAYENSQLDGVTCVVLRIARPVQRFSTHLDQWDDTEAIVLLTIIHQYDTTESAFLQGPWSSILRRMLGSQNCIPCCRPLVLRLGLLGYQWPFRTGVFFTVHRNDTISHAADVLQSIIEWNEMQNSKLHCNVLLLPSLSTELVARAIHTAGFFPLPLPPTHILDLRPHHGKTWKEYMKTLKKGNRRPYLQRFLASGGIIEEIHDLSRIEVGTTVCAQWDNIAKVRREKNEPPTLARPSVQLITAMGHMMAEPYRSVVFLRFNNEVIASSVIFKFPKKLITTDIQGLTHEKARPMKAYFVMLQWVIKEALEKKFDFVDFGPTTPGPKMDLGCIQVPLKAASYCGNCLIAFSTKKFGGVVDVVHTKKGCENQGFLQASMQKEESTQVQTNSLTIENPKMLITSLNTQAAPNGSHTVTAEYRSDISSLASDSLPMIDIIPAIRYRNSSEEQMKTVQETLDNQMLNCSKNHKSMRKKKKVELYNAGQSCRYSAIIGNSSKDKHLIRPLTPENLPMRSDEAYFNGLESHGSINHMQTLYTPSNSNVYISSKSVCRPTNFDELPENDQNEAYNYAQ